MNALVDKTQVEKQFSRAANSYNSAAKVQRQMSDRLIQTLAPYLPNTEVRQITDLGCGTGVSLYELARQYSKAELTAVDISPAMLSQTAALLPRAKIVCDDMESYLSPKQQDLIFSNASIQWCKPEKVLDQVHLSLNQDGVFAFTSFGPATHMELAQAWRRADGSEHRIDFLNLEQYAHLLEESDFMILEQNSVITNLRFEDTATLLSSIKKTGATNASSNRDRGLLSRERYRRFIMELDSHRPLTLSYESLGFVVKKKHH